MESVIRAMGMEASGNLCTLYDFSALTLSEIYLACIQYFFISAALSIDRTNWNSKTGLSPVSRLFLLAKASFQAWLLPTNLISKSPSHA